MAYKIVCNCGNEIEYEGNVNEEKTINCSRCGKPIKIRNYVGKLEVIYG
jgi:hypothetical protein